MQSTMRKENPGGLALSAAKSIYAFSFIKEECGVELRVEKQTNREEKQSQKARMSSYRLSEEGRKGGGSDNRREKRPLKETTVFRNWFQLQVLAGLESVEQAGRRFSKELSCSIVPEFHKAEGLKLRQGSVPSSSRKFLLPWRFLAFTLPDFQLIR